MRVASSEAMSSWFSSLCEEVEAAGGGVHRAEARLCWLEVKEGILHGDAARLENVRHEGLSHLQPWSSRRGVDGWLSAAAAAAARNVNAHVAVGLLWWPGPPSGITLHSGRASRGVSGSEDGHCGCSRVGHHIEVLLHHRLAHSHKTLEWFAIKAILAAVGVAHVVHHLVRNLIRTMLEDHCLARETVLLALSVLVVVVLLLHDGLAELSKLGRHGSFGLLLLCDAVHVVVKVLLLHHLRHGHRRAVHVATLLAFLAEVVSCTIRGMMAPLLPGAP
mmetsp:Transcript_142696/g.355694  ORF Transcript_142696/g.355694 Transcript_142696/m.355694 type:complete len:276 (+) Transcript_142696:659-1486(+)